MTDPVVVVGAGLAGWTAASDLDPFRSGARIHVGNGVQSAMDPRKHPLDAIRDPPTDLLEPGRAATQPSIFGSRGLLTWPGAPL